MTWRVLCAGWMLYGFALCDVAWRRVPNILTVGLFAVVSLGDGLAWWSVSWEAAAWAGLVLLVAGFPGGDVKAMIVVALVLGMPHTFTVLLGAMLLTTMLWWRGIMLVPWLLLPLVAWCGTALSLLVFHGFPW